MLQKQGLQMNQDITFLSDGGDTVRNLQEWISPQSEHVLDWFHITMRITVMRQMVKGFREDIQDRFDKQVESIKWNIWHGNVEKALERIESVCEISNMTSRISRVNSINCGNGPINSMGILNQISTLFQTIRTVINMGKSYQRHLLNQR